jgi:hypothetical protein
VVAVLARVVPDTKSGTPGADAVKVKGTITWVALHDALRAEVRLFERLFVTDQPRKAAATSARTSTRTAARRAGAGSNPRWPAWQPTPGCSSNATATSWPTATTTRPARGRCSTASPG